MKKLLIVLLVVASFGAMAQGKTTRNAFGGENYYYNGMYMGKSTRNAFGGRNFYPSPAANQQYYGYGSQVNPHLQDGAAIGWGLSNIINSFRGGANR